MHIYEFNINADLFCSDTKNVRFLERASCIFEGWLLSECGAVGSSAAQRGGAGNAARVAGCTGNVQYTIDVIYSGFFGTVSLSESVGTTVPPTFIFSPPLTLNEWQFAMNLHNYEWYGLWSTLVETPQLLNQWRWLKRLSCVFRSWNILIVTVCASTFGSCSFDLLVSFRGWFSAVTSPKSAIEASMWSACRSVWM